MHLHKECQQVTQRQDTVAPRWVRDTAVARYCDVSAVTIWRWRKNTALNFPKPALINRLPHTDLNEVDGWMKARIASRAGEAA
jgi:predicted DNA-binding transcriptional regulator AlpA